MSDERRAEVLARSLDDRATGDGQGMPLPTTPYPDAGGTDGGADAREGGTLDQPGLTDLVLLAAQGTGSAQADDPELAELIALAARLQRLGPSMALLANAETTFDPAFAQRLKGTVLAVHAATYDTGPPAVQPGTAGVSETGGLARSVARNRRAAPANGLPSPAADGRYARRLGTFGSQLRSLWGLVLLAVVAVAVAVVVTLNGATSRPQHAAVGAVATTTVRPFLMQQRVSTLPDSRSKPTPLSQSAATAGAASVAGGSSSGTAVSGSGFQPPVAPGSASQSPVAPGVATLPSPHGTATQNQGFGFYSTLQSQPPALRHASVPTIPVHYRATPPPATAPGYTLSYRPLSSAAIRRIVASFPGLRRSTPTPLVLSGLRAVRYTAGAAQLEIVVATGEVRYSYRVSPANGAHGSLDATAAQASAVQWLAEHALLPAGVTPRAGTATVHGGSVDVRFAPALPHPLEDKAGTSTAISLRIGIDSAGHVVAAERLWPSLLAAPGAAPSALPRSIPAPPASIPETHSAAGGTPTGPVASGPGSFEVERVEIVYTATGAPPSARLSPGYLLRGRLEVPGGPSQPYSVVVSGAAPPAPLSAPPTRP